MNLDINNIQPTKNYCLVEIASTEIETASGIVQSEAQAYSTPVYGTVKKAGPESSFKEGDILFFRRYSVDELKFVTEKGEQILHLVQDPDVVGVYQTNS
jgi:co-chaperonin GroES (HSP10)